MTRSSILGEKEKTFQVEGTAYVKHVGMFLICFPLPLALPTYTPLFFRDGRYKSSSLSYALSFRKRFRISHYFPLTLLAWRLNFLEERSLCDSRVDPDLVDYFQHLFKKEDDERKRW